VLEILLSNGLVWLAGALQPVIAESRAVGAMLQNYWLAGGAGSPLRRFMRFWIFLRRSQKRSKQQETLKRNAPVREAL